MQEVRFGIIGIGNMGTGHIENFEEGRVTGGKLVAICDLLEEKHKEHPNYKFYTDYKELIDSGDIDAVIVATPHYSHTYIGAYALLKKIHTSMLKD